MSEMASNDAVRKLDSLYANPKYSELDLGQALQLLSATDLAQQPENANPKSQSPTSQK
jgi:hypothetical protein